MKYAPLHYGDYLKINELTAIQNLRSAELGTEAHDETLFIIVHQVYELWFKQILHELTSIVKLMSNPLVPTKELSQVIHRLNRVTEIQRLLNDQITVMETMTSLDFLDFRDYLVPASGFQSTQFRTIEMMLGLKNKYRTAGDLAFFKIRLKQEEQEYLNKIEEQPDLLQLVDAWLSRMPFSELKKFSFWSEYQKLIETQLEGEAEIIKNSPHLEEHLKERELGNLEATRETYSYLFDEQKYQQLLDSKETKISFRAKRASIFIALYRDLPLMNQPYRLIEKLIEIDELFTAWRYRHAMMAHRMLGRKIGTGGSSGHDYLKRSTENNRVFTDFFNLSTYLVPRSKLPKLPLELIDLLSFKAPKE